jgi:hypothetical protein
MDISKTKQRLSWIVGVHFRHKYVVVGFRKQSKLGVVTLTSFCRTISHIRYIGIISELWFVLEKSKHGPLRLGKWSIRKPQEDSWHDQLEQLWKIRVEDPRCQRPPSLDHYALEAYILNFQVYSIDT